jgi:hypothetical protein
LDSQTEDKFAVRVQASACRGKEEERDELSRGEK